MVAQQNAIMNVAEVVEITVDHPVLVVRNHISKGFLKRLNCLLVPNLFRDIYYYIKHIRTGILKAYILIKTFA